jgi:hypothetical protein
MTTGRPRSNTEFGLWQPLETAKVTEIHRVVDMDKSRVHRSCQGWHRLHQKTDHEGEPGAGPHNLRPKAAGDRP